MDEYIKREAVRKAIESAFAWNRSFGDLFDEVRNIPSEDVSPVRHGRWVNTHSDSEFVQCCLCKYPVYAAWNVTNYCPNCGAKMDGDENG